MSTTKRITVTEAIDPTNADAETVTVEIDGHGLYRCFRHSLGFITKEEALERLAQVWEGEPNGGQAVIFWHNVARASVLGELAVMVAAVDTLGGDTPVGQRLAISEWIG